MSKADNAVICFAINYVQVALGREWPSFFFFVGETKFMYTLHSNIMYELDLKRQKLCQIQRDSFSLQNNFTRQCLEGFLSPLIF